VPICPNIGSFETWTQERGQGFLRTLSARCGFNYPSGISRIFWLLQWGKKMILGLILFIVGTVLLLKNRSLALMWEDDYGIRRISFNNSVARQNIAVVGALFMIAGLAMAVLF
jgi:hypothetical protein